jgi:hypothetical protein
MMTLRPAHIPEPRRSYIRPVALAYRRACRAGLHESDATGAAIREYQRLNPDAPADRLECSRIVMPMICAAINADIEWFWRGPDA